MQEHTKDFPVLASLARDYLALSGTSRACKRTCSSAADIAVPGQASLSAKMIQKLVGVRKWLNSKIPLSSKFADVAAYALAYESSKAKKQSNFY